IVEHHREVLSLARWLALHSYKLCAVRHGVEYDDEFRRKCQGNESLFAGRQFDGFHRYFVECLLQRVSRKIDARTPEYLPAVLDKAQRVGIVRSNLSHARIDRKRHLYHLVQRWHV